MKILVCGGRHYNERKKIYDTLDACLYAYGVDIEIITGGAAGADTLADSWARYRGLVTHRYPAKWDTQGKRAGILRNFVMLAQNPSRVIAFPGGRGTAHMVKIARDKGIKIIEGPAPLVAFTGE